MEEGERIAFRFSPPAAQKATMVQPETRAMFLRSPALSSVISNRARAGPNDPIDRCLIVFEEGEEIAFAEIWTSERIQFGVGLEREGGREERVLRRRPCVSSYQLCLMRFMNVNAVGRRGLGRASRQA